MPPLAGIRVVEVAQNLAGPFCGQILAQLGAEVIKLERPDGGDDARGWGPPFEEGVATTFIAVNRGKRSLTLDLKLESGRAGLDLLLGRADVLVQNLRPGLLAEMGFGPEALAGRHPRLVSCALTAFGHLGPRAAEGGYEPILQGFSGLMMMNGAEGGPPTRTAPQILDLGTGMWAAIGILAALQRRERTGRGGHVDASLLETALAWMGPHLCGFTVTGKAPPRHLSGNPNTVVFQAFATASQPIMVAAANDRLFAKLCGVMGLAPDPRFATNGLRVANKPALLALLEPAFAAAPAADWLARLTAAGIPCGPINAMAEMMREPQVRALGLIAPVPGSTASAVGLPLSFEGLRPGPAGGVPAPGADTASILHDLGAPA